MSGSFSAQASQHESGELLRRLLTPLARIDLHVHGAEAVATAVEPRRAMEVVVERARRATASGIALGFAAGPGFEHVLENRDLDVLMPVAAGLGLLHCVRRPAAALQAPHVVDLGLAAVVRTDDRLDLGVLRQRAPVEAVGTGCRRLIGGIPAFAAREKNRRTDERAHQAVTET